MKTERVTLNDCKTTIFPSHTQTGDRLFIDIKCTEISQIQRLLAICGGELIIFSAVLPSDEPEMLYWIRWSSHSTVTLTAMLTINEESYNQLLAGFGNNNIVYFFQPTALTLVDDTYFVLPDDTSLYRCSYSNAASGTNQKND
jgi:hypothetical protein